MPRFKERPLELRGLLRRFEADSHQTHVHNTRALVGRLKDEGRRFWPRESCEFRSWEKRCNKLWNFLRGIGTRRDLDKQKLTTVLKEFIQEFEDIREHLDQRLYGETDNREDDHNFPKMFNQLNLAFQASIYAGLSGEINDKPVGHLKEVGRRFWKDGASQLRRWDKGCAKFENFQLQFSILQQMGDQELTTTLREFIQEFEHNTERMDQMLYGEVHDPSREQRLADIFGWLNLVFRSAIYALVSGWIEDKQDNYFINITVNLTSGESSQENTGTGMTVPQKYRLATKPI